MKYQEVIHCYDDRKRTQLLKDLHTRERNKNSIMRRAFLDNIISYLENRKTLEEFQRSIKTLRRMYKSSK